MNFLRNLCEGSAAEVGPVMDWIFNGTQVSLLDLVADALKAAPSTSAVLQHALYVASNLTASALPVGYIPLLRVL